MKYSISMALIIYNLTRSMNQSKNLKKFYNSIIDFRWSGPIECVIHTDVLFSLWGWLEITPLKTFFSFVTFRYLSIPIKVVTQKRGNFDGLPPKMWLFNTSLRCVCTCTVLSGCLRFLDLSFMSSRVHLNYLCKNYILSYLSGSEVLNILFLYYSIKKHFYYLGINN